MAVTEADGELVWSQDYLPFGEKIEQDRDYAYAETHGLTGKEYDEATGLYYYNARWYDPGLGRFITEDPIRDRLNWYLYALGNPLIWIDSSGLRPTAIEAAHISKHVYPGNQDHELPGGWILCEYIDAGTLQMGIYSRMKKDGNVEYVIANAGTSTESKLHFIKDMVQNVKQPFGKSSDMKSSIARAKSIATLLTCNNETTFVGHSKGGAEAVGNALATNKDAIIFNPAELAFNEYELDRSKYVGNITAYVVKDEILNTVFGELPDFYEVVYLTAPYPERKLKNKIVNHSIDAVIKALEVRERER